MHIPLFVSVPLCLVVAVLTFWLGAKRHDFVTPPPEQQLLQLEAALEEKYRPIDSEDFVPVAPAPREIASAPAEIEPEEIATIDIRAAEIAPSLDEYLAPAAAEASYTTTLELARQLGEQGFIEREYLAWERLLDSLAAPPNVHRQALEATARLRTMIPAWTVDPSEVFELSLQGSATSIDTTTLESTLTAVAKVIEQSSSGIVSITPKLTVGEQRQSDRILPIAVWISQRDTNDGSTFPATFIPTGDDPAAVKRSVATIVYQLVRNRLEKDARFRPLPQPGPSDNPLDLIAQRITRLQWQAFANTIAPIAIPQPPGEEGAETTVE